MLKLSLVMTTLILCLSLSSSAYAASVYSSGTQNVRGCKFEVKAVISSGTISAVSLTKCKKKQPITNTVNILRSPGFEAPVLIASATGGKARPVTSAKAVIAPVSCDVGVTYVVQGTTQVKGANLKSAYAMANQGSFGLPCA